MQALLPEHPVSVGVPIRTCNKLDDHGITTVEGLLNMTQEELLELPDVGEGALRHVLTALAEHGFTAKTGR